MRLVWGLGFALLVGCGGSSRGPAWPKQSFAEVDGGESIAPRQTAAIVEDDEGEDDEEVADAVAPAEPEKPADKPAATTSEPSPAADNPAEDPIMIDDIVIEIDEDE